MMTKEPDTNLNADISRLMALAEEIEVRIDRIENKKSYLISRCLQIWLITAIGCFLLGYFNIVNISLCILISLAIFSLTSIVFNLLKNPYDTNIQSEKRALKSVLDLLLEVEPATAKNEGWSTLQRAEFRIRLSRFNVAPHQTTDSNIES